MDNLEYIKSLEERIEKLEKIISSIKLEDSENITFTNCQIQGLALEKCKGVTIKDFTVEGLGFASLNAKIENANIQNFQNQSGKVKMQNCTIKNKE